VPTRFAPAGFCSLRFTGLRVYSTAHTCDGLPQFGSYYRCCCRLFYCVHGCVNTTLPAFGSWLVCVTLPHCTLHGHAHTTFCHPHTVILPFCLRIYHLHALPAHAPAPRTHAPLTRPRVCGHAVAFTVYACPAHARPDTAAGSSPVRGCVYYSYTFCIPRQRSAACVAVLPHFPTYACRFAYALSGYVILDCVWIAFAQRFMVVPLPGRLPHALPGLGWSLPPFTLG